MHLKSIVGVLIAVSIHQTVFGWDATGHMLVAQIAASRLPQDVKAKVDADIAAFNLRYDGQYDMVAAACWMDDIRSKTNEYEQWHFIDIPLNRAVEPDTMKTPNGFWLANQCIAAIQTGTPFATAHDGAPIDRSQALVMLLHIVGDLHQPLHCVNNNDRGGNEVSVTNMVETVPSETNLHHLWDTAYRRSFDGGIIQQAYSPTSSRHAPPFVQHKNNEPMIAQKASQLVTDYPPDANWKVAAPTDWSKESYAAAQATGYGLLPGGSDAKSVTLPSSYVTSAKDEASKRIVLAGFRLAELLKSLYAPQ